jgi:glucan biosynthesis protein C
MISGYFTPISYDRKGYTTFLKERFLRLGIPLVVFSLVVIPFFWYILYYMDFRGGDYLSYWEFLLSKYYWQTHHLWFLVNVLVLDCCYVICRLIPNPVKAIERKPLVKIPGNRSIVMVVAWLAVAAFVVRIWYPIGRFDPLKLAEPAHLPKYVSLFVIGSIAYRRGWLFAVPASVGMNWLLIGSVTASLFPFMYVRDWEQFTPFVGGFHWQSLVFATWESIVCIGLCIGLVVLFREDFNGQGNLGRVLTANAYTVYLIHLVVVVFLQYALITANLYPFMKFVLVTSLGILLSFLISHYLKKLPFAERIL